MRRQEAQRRSNVRMGWLLAGLVALFGGGFVLRMLLVGA